MEVVINIYRKLRICREVWVSVLFWNILSQKLGSWWLWACACGQGHPALSTGGLAVTSERTEVLLEWVSGLP